MSHRALAGLIIALVASSSQSQAQPSAIAEAAQREAVEVGFVSFEPVVGRLPDNTLALATPASNGIDWCVDGFTATMLTAHAVASQNDLTQGTIALQVCEGGGQGQAHPKEDCDVGHGAHWKTAVSFDISLDSTPTFFTGEQLPVFGFRFQYRPVSGSGFARATGVSFNLIRGTTCP